MRKNIPYKVGDKVFAKLKGYPAWPAKITADNGRNFSVQFYGTGEVGFIKSEDLYYYLKYKHRFAKPSKRKEFNDAIDEIESEIQEGGTDGNTAPDNENKGDSTLNSTPGSAPDKKKRKISDGSNDSNIQSVKRPIRQKRLNSRGSSDSLLQEQNSLQTSTCNDFDITKSVIEGDESSHSVVEDELTSQDIKKKLDNKPNDEIEEEKPDENKKDLDIKLLSEENLKVFISYAQYVKDNSTTYKSKNVEHEYYQDEVFPVKLSTGKFEGLKFHKEWPINITNEYDSAVYDEENGKRLLELKKSIDSGEVVNLESNQDLFIKKFELTENEIVEEFKQRTIENKTRINERLKIESALVDLETKIKNCLGLQKADPKQALEYLNEMLTFKIDDLMLKKHAHILEVIRRLRKYVGNTEAWNFDGDTLKQFSINAQKVRRKAEEVYEKFKDAIKLPENTTNFWDGFSEALNKYKEQCKDMSDHEKLLLCSEPYTRQAFMDKLELKNLEMKNELQDIEKENSSEVANSECSERS